ncbi:hypothetical protein [Streptomyces sp. NPDC051636]|uniref:hypothetical protein n=1 Tax=Streptomyces sp. NPDC051636 TaxID=3365663 RepID=UPI00378958F8
MTAQLGTGVGSMAEYVRFGPGYVVRVPDALSLTDAAALPLAGVTAVQALRRTRDRAGRRVPLVGAKGQPRRRLALRLLDEPATRTDLLVRPGDGETWQELRTRPPRRGRGADRPGARRGKGVRHRRGRRRRPGPDRGGVTGWHVSHLHPVQCPRPDPARRPELEFVLHGVELNRDDLAEMADRAARDTGLRQRTTILPFADAQEAHRRLETGGFRGKFVLVP